MKIFDLLPPCIVLRLCHQVIRKIILNWILIFEIAIDLIFLELLTNARDNLEKERLKQQILKNRKFTAFRTNTNNPQQQQNNLNTNQDRIECFLSYTSPIPDVKSSKAKLADPNVLNERLREIMDFSILDFKNAENRTSKFGHCFYFRLIFL